MRRLILGTDSYAKEALREGAIVDHSARYVVYGHTHHAEVVPLSADDDGSGREQLHFNSGTWRCVHERCIRPGDELRFAASHVMTWLTVYAHGERKGRCFETWNGQLDMRRRDDGALLR